jgi:hypothetical protein
MLSANTDELEKSLAEYKAEVERKLKHMVVGFAQDVAEAASQATRKGHISEGGNTAKYVEYYKKRAKSRSEGGYGIEALEGFHKGAWTYTEGTLEFNPVIYDVPTMLGNVDYKAQANYKIGDTFTIGATGPAYEELEILDDIRGKAESTIQGAYLSDLKQYYEEG